MPNGDIINQAEINRPINIESKGIKKRGEILNFAGYAADDFIVYSNVIIDGKMNFQDMLKTPTEFRNVHFTKETKDLSNFLANELPSPVKYFSTFDMDEMAEDVDLTDFFGGCIKLEYVEFKNLRKGFEKAGVYRGSPTGAPMLNINKVLPEMLYELLPQDEVIEIKMDVLGDYLSAHYCRIIDKTDPKKKFKMCKETDRGAMTLLDYALKKNWKITK